MDMDMEMKKQLLDKLMGEMDDYQANEAKEKPMGAVAVVEEKKIIPAKTGEELQQKVKETPVYLNPKRQSVLDQVEEQAPHGPGEPAPGEQASTQANDDDFLPGRFKKFGKSMRRG